MRVSLAVGTLLGLPVALAAQQYAWVRSPVNGHEYALTAPLTWQSAEAAAQAGGAHLATVRSVHEQQWIESQFGTNENLWIGLNDQAVQGDFVWSSGEDSSWRNWCPNEPNGRPNEDYVHIAAFPGQCNGPWNDAQGNRSYRGLIERIPVVFDWEWAAPEPAPAGRLGATSAYDPQRGVAVVAGGVLSLGGTFEWDGRAWSAIPGNSFSLLSAEIAYDGRGVIGVSGGATWRWDGSTWTDLQVTGTPTVGGLRLAYDAVRDRVVAFGGLALITPSNDTWEWDGSSWTLAAPTTRPSPRIGHALCYDAGAGKVVLFGGSEVLPTRLLQDTWEWDGVNWVQRTPTTTPPARRNHSLTYVSGTGLSVLCGGSDGNAALSDLWIWDGSDWFAPVAPVGVAVPRFMHTAFCFPGLSGQEVLLFGGATTSTPALDTQSLRSVRPFAAYRLRGEGCSGSTTPALTFAGQPSFGSTFTLRATGLPTYQATVLLFGFANDFAGQPLPFDLLSLGMPGCDLWSSADVALPYVSSPAGVVTSTWTVPQDPGLLGLYFNNQMMVRDPGAGGIGVVSTGGGEGVFGR